MARKGKKAGGRSSELTAAYTIRMPAGLRRELEEAATLNKRDLSDEIRARLDASFNAGDEIDPAIRELAWLLSQLAWAVVNVRDDQGRPEIDWRADPWMYQAFKLAVAYWLDYLAPPGPIEPSFDLDELVKSGRIPKFAVDSFRTPEARARDAAAWLATTYENSKRPAATERELAEKSLDYSLWLERERHMAMAREVLSEPARKRPRK